MTLKNRYTARMNRVLVAIALGAALVVPALVDAATIYVNPTEGTYGLSDTFITDIRLDNQNECVNAIHVEIRYPTETLRAVDFSKGNSILSLWIEEPKIDTDKGTISFSGGIPGGYCGRIPGDPVLSNVLGKIVFSVVGAEQKSATVSVEEGSAVYKNDGQGSRAELTRQSGIYSIKPTPLSATNPWLAQVGDDKTPPDEFVITVESTRGVFGGDYYAVFSTEDKQSGLDHYEIFERGSWRPVTSPHQLKDQHLLNIQIKAIDKAGNERMGTYVQGSAAPRVPEENDYSIAIAVVIGLLLLGGYMWYRDRKRKASAAA
jgi:hypothetical protein